MGLFDSLKRMAESTVKREVNSAVNNAVNNAVDSIGKGRNHTETFSSRYRCRASGYSRGNS